MRCRGVGEMALDGMGAKVRLRVDFGMRGMGVDFGMRGDGAAIME